MKVFLDTNILLDIALSRDSLSQASEESVMYCVDQNIPIFISWHTISNAYYVIRNKKARGDAYEFLFHFVTNLHIEIAEVGTKNLLRAFEKDMNDFEDAMQIAAST